MSTRKLPPLTLDELKDLISAAQPVQRVIIPAVKGWRIVRVGYEKGCKSKEDCVDTFDVIGWDFQNNGNGQPVFYDPFEKAVVTWDPEHFCPNEVEILVAPGWKVDDEILKSLWLEARTKYRESLREVANGNTKKD